MKKKLCALLALPLLFGFAAAQNFEIPDGHFENWKTGRTDWGDTYDELANPFWASLNLISGLPPESFTGPVTMFKDRGRSGADDDFAPKMVSNEMRFGTDSTYIFLPGVVGTLEVLVTEQSAIFGRPFPSRPAAIKGYMKYHPVNGDSASIFVEVHRYNEAGKRVIFGRVEHIFKDSIKAWTPFELPITYNSDATPDSITVLFVSSAGYDFDDLFACEGQVGSTLWVDDVEFVYEGSSVNENSVLASSKLYPNPSRNGIFNLSVKEACHIDVISATGMLMMQQDFVAAGAYTVDLSRFATGVYYIRLTNRQGSAVLKAIKR